MFGTPLPPPTPDRSQIRARLDPGQKSLPCQKHQDCADGSHQNLQVQKSGWQAPGWPWAQVQGIPPSIITDFKKTGNVSQINGYQELVPKTCQLAASGCCSGTMATAQRNPGQRWPWDKWMRAEAPDAWMKTGLPIRSVTVLVNDTQFSKPARSQHFHPCVDLEGLWGPETFCLEDSDFGHIHANTAHSCSLFIAQETGNTKARGWALQNNLVTNSELPKGIPYRHLSYIHVCTHTHPHECIRHAHEPEAPKPCMVWWLVPQSPTWWDTAGKHSQQSKGRRRLGCGELSHSNQYIQQSRHGPGWQGAGRGTWGHEAVLRPPPQGGLRTCKGTQWQSPLQHPRGVCSPGRSEHTVGCPRQRSAGAPAIKSDCAQQHRALLLVSKSIISFVQGKPYFEAEWTYSTVAGTHFILHLDAWAAWRSRVLAHQPQAPHHSI